MTTIVGPLHIELADREPSKCIDQKWLAIPPDSIEYRAFDGDTGETNGGHWCGGEAGDWGASFTYCAFLPPKLGFLKDVAE